MRAAYADGMPIYPIGGGTSLEYGLAAKKQGLGLSLANINRLIDYPARDMTVTVEAGIAMSMLAELLAGERQWLPIDTPQPEQATLGGVIATAFSGPRRYGWGTMRDYVIGIRAVDGRGMVFNAGGRVVKNVAGYDFCKLLTGSLGTLGVITQVTLKIKPIPEASAFVVCGVPDLVAAERVLASLVHTRTAPAAIELLAGPQWEQSVINPALGSAAQIAVGVEGTASEVAWMTGQLSTDLAAQSGTNIRTLRDEEARELWARLRDFPAAAGSPLVVKASIRPSAVTGFVHRLLRLDPSVSIQAHAGNGIVIAQFNEFESANVSRQLVGDLQPAAQAAGGHIVVLSSTFGGDLTRQAWWGAATDATHWMQSVKKQFDPKGLLNPGRYIYPAA